MRRVLISSLAIFVLIDIFLAIKLLNPMLFSSLTRLIPTSRVSVSSEIPNKKVTMRNENYLDKKLKELDFWSKDKVILYPKSVTRGNERVTVERLRFILTDKPQEYGEWTSSQNSKKVEFSYGQIYDTVTKEMTLLLHIDPAFYANKSLHSRYTNVALYTVFHLIHQKTSGFEEGVIDPNVKKKATLFFQDYSKNQEKLSIFKIL